MSKNDDVIVQSSHEFATLVAQLMPATTVLHVSQADIILQSNQRMGRYSLLLLLELGVTAIEWVRCCRRNRSRKARKMWVHPHITEREGQGAYANLLAELRRHEEDPYKNFLRMPPYVFDWLLSLVAPLIQKQDTKYRASISHGEQLAITLRLLATVCLCRQYSRPTTVGEKWIGRNTLQVPGSNPVHSGLASRTPGWFPT